MPQKTLGTLIAVALVGGVLGSLFVSPPAQANLWDSILDFLRPPPAGVVPPPSDKVTAPQEPPREESPAPAPVPAYAPSVDYEQAVVRAVERATPSVVSIVISKDVPIIEQCPYDPFSDVPPEFREFFGGGFGGFTEPCERGTRRQQVGGGSGFIVSTDGLVVTNKHVVSDAKADYTVFLNDGTKYPATVVARDSFQDLALLKIDATGLMPVVLGNSDSLKLGQTAIAIGYSLGEFRNTVSVGVISGLARTITASGASYGSETLQGVIQTDAAINPGNSGGPLLNLKGEVVGINVAVASGAENIGFAIPVNQVKRSIESVKRTGTIQTPYIGVRYLMLSDNIAKEQKLPATQGALVRGTADGPGVIPDSPAEKSGIQAEDVVTAMNGEALTEENPLSVVIRKYNVGDTVTLTVVRGSTTLTLPLTLGERPTE